MTNILKLSVSIVLIFFISCKTSEPVVDVVKSSQKEVTALTLGNISGATSTFDASTNTHTFSVPSGTNIKALALTFTLPSGATSSPTSGSVQDFTNPVSYTITAEDGTKQVVKVAVNVQAAPKSSEKQILEFSFNSLNPVVKANIDQPSRKITTTVTASTDLTKLIPTIITSPKSSVSPASGVVQNFSNPVVYEVTAEDGSKVNYEVVITKEAINSTEKIACIFKGFSNVSGVGSFEYKFNSNNEIESSYWGGDLFEYFEKKNNFQYTKNSGFSKNVTQAFYLKNGLIDSISTDIYKYKLFYENNRLKKIILRYNIILNNLINIEYFYNNQNVIKIVISTPNGEEIRSTEIEYDDKINFLRSTQKDFFMPYITSYFILDITNQLYYFSPSLNKNNFTKVTHFERGSKLSEYKFKYEYNHNSYPTKFIFPYGQNIKEAEIQYLICEF